MIPLPPGRMRNLLAPLRGRVIRLERAGSGPALQLTLDAIGLRPAFGPADVIVVRGDRGEGLTEDYLTVSLGAARLPRGTRVQARLELSEDRLLAMPATVAPSASLSVPA